MNILPKKSFTIKTEMTPREVHSLLLSKTEPKKKSDFFFGCSTDKPFCGEVGLFDFKISAVLQYRNSFNPIIIGRVNPSGSGSEISIDMRLSKGVKVFLLIFCIFAAVIESFVTAIAIATGQIGVILAPLPSCIFILLAAFLMTFVGFRISAKRAEQELRTLFTY